MSHQRFFFSTRLPKLIVPIVYLGGHLRKPYSFSVPDNDNMWKFGTGPDEIRRMISSETRKC